MLPCMALLYRISFTESVALAHSRAVRISSTGATSMATITKKDVNKRSFFDDGAGFPMMAGIII